MATINPLGDTLEEYYQNLIAGKSGVVRFRSLDLSKVECKIGGDIGDYDTAAALERQKDVLGAAEYKRIKRLFRSATFSARTAVLTAIEAYRHAGLLGVEVDPYRTSILVAGHNLNSNYIYKNFIQFTEEPEYMDPLSSVEAIDPNVPALISEVLKLNGPTFTLGGACASGNLALRDGVRDIVTGEADRVVCTGAVFDVSAADIQASVIINSVVMKPEFQDNPAISVRPFDTRRDGFVYSHGAATLILEDLESAVARGAEIYGEVLGVRANANANHLPVPGAEQQAWVMSELLRSTGVEAEQVDYANCHATGTPVGDIQEVKAIKIAFGEHAYDMKLNAAKSMLGHTCWASPLVETIAGLLQMQHERLHPTINIDELDPEVDLDVCKDGPVDHHINYMLKNSFGFGGINCCSLIKRYTE
jgi:3-oxoacyl-(acyl-carrier-protein) synthase